MLILSLYPDLFHTDSIQFEYHPPWDTFTGKSALLRFCHSYYLKAFNRCQAQKLETRSKDLELSLLTVWKFFHDVAEWFEFSVQDLSPKYAAALLGITNTAGAIPGVLGISSVGVLLDKTNSWSISLFFPIIACQLFGLIIYSIFASSERQHQWTWDSKHLLDSTSIADWQPYYNSIL